MIIRKFLESTDENMENVWIYDEKEIRDVLRQLVVNAMAKDDLQIDYYLRNALLNKDMNKNLYKPKNIEMAEAYTAAGFIPCISLKMSTIVDRRIVMTELGSLLRRMPEYILYKTEHKGENWMEKKPGEYTFHLKLDETGNKRPDFPIPNTALAKYFPAFEAMWFECIIEKVNIPPNQFNGVGKLMTSFLALQNVSSKVWDNPCYVMTMERIYKRNEMDSMSIDAIRSLNKAIDIYEEAKAHYATIGTIVHEAYKFNETSQIFNIILKDR